MSKKLEEMSFNELRDYIAQQLFDGLLTGGGKEFKARLHMWMGQIIQWDKAQKPKR